MSTTPGWSISGGVVGVNSTGDNATISGTSVTGSINATPEQQEIRRLIAEFEDRLNKSALPEFKKRAAVQELREVEQAAGKPGEESKQSLAFHIDRVLDVVRENAPLVGMATGIASLVGLA